MKNKDYKTVKDEYRTRLGSLRAQYKAERKKLAAERADALSGCEPSSRTVKNPPKRPVLEEIGNAVTHGTGTVFAIIAFLLMSARSSEWIELLGAAIYSVGLGLMFTVSCLYHSFPYGSSVKRIFRRFDYSCIYLLIGATFAPILLCYVGGTFGLVFFIIQWSVIATGITMVGVFGPARLRWLHFPLYMLLGWCGLMFLPEMVMRGDYAFLSYILGGGAVYSLGMIPFALKRGPSHFIWHFFVLAGAVVQWVGVYITVYIK